MDICLNGTDPNCSGIPIQPDFRRKNLVSHQFKFILKLLFSSLGLPGYIMLLFLLFKEKTYASSPSFLFHKAIALCDLLTCLAFVVQISKGPAGIDDRWYRFTGQFLFHLSSKFLTNVVSYVLRMLIFVLFFPCI